MRLPMKPPMPAPLLAALLRPMLLRLMPLLPLAKPSPVRLPAVPLLVALLPLNNRLAM